MTRNEAIKWLTEFSDIIDQSNGAVDLEELTARGLMDHKLALTEISELFESLDEKHGEWIVEEYGWGRVYHCSNCDFETSSIRSRLFSWGYPTHCPRCGTNMKNIQEARHIAWLRDNLEELIETGRLSDYEQKFKIFTYILETKKKTIASGIKKNPAKERQYTNALIVDTQYIICTKHTGRQNCRTFASIADPT